jgi:hypothetical protein
MCKNIACSINFLINFFCLFNQFLNQFFNKMCKSIKYFFFSSFSAYSINFFWMGSSLSFAMMSLWPRSYTWLADRDPCSSAS